MTTAKKVVVIGGGLGGMSAALSLRTLGYEVTLCEKNAHMGGKLNVREKQGFRFDLGPSIIILPQLFRRLFERAGMRMEDYVQLEALEPQWRSFFEDGVKIDLYGDPNRMRQELERTGADAAAYAAFVEHSRRLYEFTQETYFEQGADTVWEIARGHGPFEILRTLDLLRTVHGGVGRFIREPRLHAMLDFFVKYVGSSAYDAPGMLNLLPYSQLGFGLFYVTGGMYNLARGLERLMRELGVDINLGCEVTAIEKNGDRVTGVGLADGRSVAADVVVSNMEVIPAYERLLHEPNDAMMRRYRKKYEPAASGLVVHLGVDCAYPELQHHNFFFSRDPKHFFTQIHRKKELPDDPTIYLVCPTVTDPALAPAGHHIIKILPHIPYIQPEPYEAADYQALKERVYDKLERMGLTDLRRHVVVEDVLVPDDLERMYYSNKGAIYGVVSDRRKNLALKAPKKSERYRNLYFVGGSVNPGGGTPMVVLSGQLVAARIAREHAQGA